MISLRDRQATGDVTAWPAKDQVKALNKRPVTTDSKAGAVKGVRGLAVDLLVAVMFEGRGTMA
jgi:hypothetical protein